MILFRLENNIHLIKQAICFIKFNHSNDNTIQSNRKEANERKKKREKTRTKQMVFIQMENVMRDCIEVISRLRMIILICVL